MASRPLWWRFLGLAESGRVKEGSGSAEFGGDDKGGFNEVWDQLSGGGRTTPRQYGGVVRPPLFLKKIYIIIKIKLKKLIF